jgi:hypothetical protein
VSCGKLPHKQLPADAHAGSVGVAMPARHQIESQKFWDIVTLWAKEQLESEEVIARAMAFAWCCSSGEATLAQRPEGRVHTKDDFRRWLRNTKQELRAFWFARGEGAA